MAQDPTKLQVALANAASKLLQMHNTQIAKTDPIHICDDPGNLTLLRALAEGMGKAFDDVFAAIAEAADVAPTYGDYAMIVSDALEGSLQFSMRAKVDAIYDARSERTKFDDFRDLRTRPGRL